MKIAIKLPDDIRERILSFPFLHELEKILDDLSEDREDISQLHLISSKDNIDVLNLLPFHAFYHEIEPQDSKNILSMYRACKYFKMNQIDLYVSLSDKFVDATIAKNINAKDSLGFANGKNNLLLKNKINRNQALHFSEQIYAFLKEIKKDTRNIKTVCSRTLPSLYPDWSENKYVTINLDLVDGEINSEWADFVGLFQNKTFVFLSSELNENFQKSKIEDFIKTLSQENTYKVFEYSSNIELGKLLSYSVCFITSDSPLYMISTYCGCHTFLLNSGEDLRNKGTQFFVGKLRHFDKTDPAYSQSLNFNYDKIFDELYEFIDSRIKDVVDD